MNKVKGCIAHIRNVFHNDNVDEDFRRIFRKLQKEKQETQLVLRGGFKKTLKSASEKALG